MTQEIPILKRLIVTGSIWSLISSGLIAFLSLGSSLMLGRLLSPADFGIFAMIMIVEHVCSSFIGLCIGPAMVQQLDLSREEVSSALWLHISTGLILYAIISISSPLIALLFKEPLLCKLIPIVALSFVIGSAGQLYVWLLERELAFALLAKQETFVELVTVAVTLGLALHGFGVWSLCWGYVARHVLLSTLRTWAGWSRWKPQLHFRWKEIRRFLRFGIYQMGEGVIINLSYKLDKMLIGWLLGSSALGLYEFVTQRLLAPLGTISDILLRNAFPYLAKIQYEKITLRKSFITLSKMLNIIDAPLLVGTTILAPIMIPALFGEEWKQAIPLVPLLAAVQIFRRINNQSGTLLMAIGRPEISFRWHFIILFISSIPIIPGALFYGINGVVLAVFISMGISTIVSYFMLIKPVTGTCGNELSSAFLKPAFFAVTIGIVVRQFAPIVNHGSWLFIISISGLLLYIGLFWFVERNALAAWNES